MLDGMTEGPGVPPEPAADLEERLELARDAFMRYYAMCFWSWSRETVITPGLLPNIAHALRSSGGRQQWVLSEVICPSTLYRARCLPRYARSVIPIVT
jgi:hypothetical protein